MEEIPNCPKIDKCQCYSDGYCPCECEDTEKALRAWCNPKNGVSIPKMTPDQREWCLKEIHQVEGYDRKYFENDPDELVANGVLSAWVDYCRDKGLL